MLPLGRMVNTASQHSAICAWEAALAPLSHRGFHRLLVQVVDIELAPRPKQIERHGPAHDPQSHKSDFHTRIPPRVLSHA